MVTHDPSLTSRTTRNLTIADGLIVGDSKKLMTVEPEILSQES